MRSIIANRNIFYTILGFFFVFFGFDASQQYIVPLFTLQGKGHIAFISLLLIYGSLLVCGIFAPRIISTLGLKRSLLFGAGTYLLFTLSLITSSDLVIYFFAMLMGFGAALLWNSSGQIIAASSAKDVLGKNLGLQYSAVYLGGMVGVATGALLVHNLSFAELFVYFAFAIAIGLFFLSRIKSPQSPFADKALPLSYAFNKKFLLLFPLVFSGYFLIAHTFTAMNLFVLNVFGLTYVGILSTILKTAITIGALTIGKISDIYRKEKILYVLFAIAGIGIGLFILTKTLALIIIGIIFIGCFIASVYPVTLSLVRERTTHQEFSLALGSFHIYANTAVLSSIFMSYAFDPGISFVPVVFAILLACFTLQLFIKNYP